MDTKQKELSEADIEKIAFSMALNRHPGDMGRGIKMDSASGTELARALLAEFDTKYFSKKKPSNSTEEHE